MVIDREVVICRLFTDDTDLSESEAVSGAQITSPASAPSETEEESRDGMINTASNTHTVFGGGATAATRVAAE